ncbi:hypothetical protein [Sphaerisporangium sp. NPDC051011]|uniref:hypothetical protein n=1 Tax=Sphaerisporangium sp. NPDC051011 TaxID=3155792 RepID=UPI0033E3AE95
MSNSEKFISAVRYLGGQEAVDLEYPEREFLGATLDSGNGERLLGLLRWAFEAGEAAAASKSAKVDGALVAETATVTVGQPSPINVPVQVGQLIEHLAQQGVMLGDESWSGCDVVNAVSGYLGSYGLSV